MNIDEQCDELNDPCAETMDLDVKVESDPELTQTECPDPNPEEEVSLTASSLVEPNSSKTTNPTYQSKINVAMIIHEKYVDVTEKGGSNNEEKLSPLQARTKIVTDGTKMIPLQVKGGNVECTIKISEEKMSTLIQKQKAGVPILLAMSKTQTLGPLIKSSQTLKVSKPPNNSTMLPKAQPKLLQLSEPVKVCKIAPKTLNIEQSKHSSIPAVNTSSSTQALPINSHPSPLISPNPVITSQNCKITTLNNAPSKIQGVLGMLTGTQNAPHTTVSNVPQKGSSCTVVAPSIPLNTARSSINVLPQSPSSCHSARRTLKILPKRYIPIKAASSIFSPIEPNQPRFLLTDANSASNKEIAPYQLKIHPSPHGGNVMLTKTSQNGTTSNQNLSGSSPVVKTNRSSTMMMVIKNFRRLRWPVTEGGYTANVVPEGMMPRVRPDGSVRLEAKIIPSGKMAERAYKSQSNFTLREVGNNPLASGVAKKFVVSPANDVPFSSCANTVRSTTSASANTTKTIRSAIANAAKPVQLTTSTISTAKPVQSPTVSTAPVTNGGTSALLLSKGSMKIRHHSPVNGGTNSNKSSVQWHHPYIGDSSSTADGPEIAGGNDPVSISDDGQPPPKISSPLPLVAGVPDIINGTVCISDTDGGLDSVGSSPFLENTEKHPVISPELSSNGECTTENSGFSPGIEISNIHSMAQSALVDELNSESICTSPTESTFQWHEPVIGAAEALSSRDYSALNENQSSRVQNEAPPVKFHIREGRYGPRTIETTKKKKLEKNEKVKKKKKKKKEKKKARLNENTRDMTNSKTVIRKDVSSSSNPTSVEMDPLSVRTSSPSLEGNSFQWHCPVGDAIPENATEKSELVRHSALKMEPVSLPLSNEQQPHGYPSTGYAQGSGKTEEAFEPKYSPRSDPEASVINDQDFPRVEYDSINSGAAVEGCTTTSRTSKRTLVGGQDEAPRKFPKKIRSSASNQHNEQKGNVSKLSNGHATQKDSSGDKRGNSNVLRDCIVRKTVQDCYLQGVIPTIDKIHDACCSSGLELAKTSVEPHLTSIGYKWVLCKSQKLLLEDYRSTSERIKYMNKLKKYRGKNLVFIFVSEYVKRKGNTWQVSPKDVKRPSLDAARIVLHVMSNNHLLEGGLEIVKIGLFGLRRNDILSWLKCSVIPNIPQGSVVIFGNHPAFDKDEETEERPNIGYSKKEIVSWLTSHKVTSVNPELPKALLLCKANNVILPKTSMFDKLVRQNGFIPLHLPKYHMDLNPVAFMWQDILDKLYKTPEVISVDDLQDFVAQEFSSCSRALSSVSCDLVRKFGCSYREFDSRSDELIEKLLSDTTPVTETARVVKAFATTSPAVDAAKVVKAAATEKTGGRRSGKYPLSQCPICLGTKRLLEGYKCSMCKNFWRKLQHVYKFRHETGATLPVCKDITHSVARPPDCMGCRRHRYELALFNQVNIMKKRHSYILPIPPVTEIGKKHWAKLSKRRSKKPSNLSRKDFQEDEEEN